MPEYLRLNGRHLQTPVHHYAHPDTGRRVSVIATMHAGEAAYFGELRALIAELRAAGAVVQCEGSRLLPCDETALTADEQEVLTHLRRCQELEKRRIDELGWVGQIDGLGYPPAWKVVDLDQAQIIRRAGVHAMRGYVQRMSVMFDWSEDDRRGLARLRLRTALALRVMASDQPAAQRATTDPAEPVFLDQRTAVALEGVFSTDRDAVLVWGAKHLPGLRAGLGERGFVQDGEPRWHTAVRVPSIGACLWRLVIPGSRQRPGRAAGGVR
jgi:hypothetical protein